MVLRLEDIDPQRSKPEYEDGILRDFTWLGLDWDYGPRLDQRFAPYRQSERRERYAAILSALRSKGVLYPCFCTRKELRSLPGAPQAGDGVDLRYPGTCAAIPEYEAHRRMEAGQRYAWRCRFPLEAAGACARFHDRVMGVVEYPAQEVAEDFALYRSDGVVAYQLAVTADDMAMGVTEVVRGNDLASSTPRQQYLYRLLGGHIPAYAHVPLVLDYEAERLAKRHGALSLKMLREQGVRPESVIGFLAHLGGLIPDPAPLTAKELIFCFQWSKVKKNLVPLPVDVVGALLRIT